MKIPGQRSRIRVRNSKKERFTPKMVSGGSQNEVQLGSPRPQDWGIEDLPPMNLSDFPPYRPGEPLEEYLRRTLAEPKVSLGALSRWLRMQRTALYKIKNGGGAALETTVRFGALSGALLNDEPTRSLMSQVGLLDVAEDGWLRKAVEDGTVK